MIIEIRKKTDYLCEYTITRSDASKTHFVLETKTYVLHDICHYAVEKHLEYTKGFWGMIAAGYRLSDLLGKNNPQTDALRFIENIVGPVQSLLWGHLSVDDFEQYTQHINFRMPSNILTACVAEARQLFNYWNQLVMGQQLVLEWTLPINQELKISI